MELTVVLAAGAAMVALALAGGVSILFAGFLLATPRPVPPSRPGRELRGQKVSP